LLSIEIKKELRNMAICILILTILMLVIFWLSGYFGSDTVFGALMGSGVAFLNFFFLALAVEKSVKNNQNPKMVVASSYTMRMLFMGIMIVIAIKSPHINYVAMVIPLIFPRISILILNFLKKRNKR